VDNNSLFLAAYILRGLRLVGQSSLAPMYDGYGLDRNSATDQKFFCSVLAGLHTCGYITGPNENVDENGVAYVSLTEQGEAKADSVEEIYARHNTV
jgi:hypothetical protein